MFSGLARESNQARGVSLVEALIASSLSLMLLAALAYVFWARQVHSERVNARVELNEVALSALGHLKREVGESSLRCIDVSESGSLIFPSPRTADSDFANLSGGLQFHKMVCYRVENSGDEDKLVRQEEMFPSPTPDPPEPIAMTPQRNRLYFETSGLPPRVIARGVTLFESRLDSLKPDDPRGGRINIRLGLQRNVRHRSFGIEVQTSVAPRN